VEGMGGAAHAGREPSAVQVGGGARNME